MTPVTSSPALTASTVSEIDPEIAAAIAAEAYARMAALISHVLSSFSNWLVGVAAHSLATWPRRRRGGDQ